MEPDSEVNSVPGLLEPCPSAPKPSSLRPLSEAPFLSVILPVRNESERLPELLAALEAQEYPHDRFEIIVADGRSTDETRAVVLAAAERSKISIRLVDNERIRSGPGRNAGVRASRGEVVVFIDGHCAIPSHRLLLDTAAVLQETGVECLCRPQPLIAPCTSEMGRVIAAVRESWLGHGRDSLIYDLTYAGLVDPTTSGAVYRREVFDEVGLYDEKFDACEDCDFNLRVRKHGFSAYTDPRLAVHYEPRSTLRGLLKQMVRYGRGRVRLMKKHPDYISASQFAPLVLLLLFIAVVPAAFLPLAWGTLLWGIVVLFVALVCVVSFQLAMKHHIRSLWKAPAAFLCIYLGLGAGMLLELSGW